MTSTRHCFPVPYARPAGRLIPAGTGSYLRGLQKIAAKRDEALTASREETMEPLPAEIAEAAAEEA